MPRDRGAACEVVDLDVIRVWQVGACRAPGCCPGAFLLDAGDGDFVFVSAWTLTSWLATDEFPGAHVTFWVLSVSGRVAAGAFSGATIPYEARDLGESWFDLPPREFSLLSSSEVKSALQSPSMA